MTSPGVAQLTATASEHSRPSQQDAPENVHQTRFCESCGVAIKPRIAADGKPDRRYAHKKYCSHRCSCAKLHRKYKEPNPTPAPGVKLPTATTGALSELLVSADLMRRGWNVFRALSPSCPCDLMITKESEILRVEVRTGYIKASGTMGYAWSSKDIGRSDVVAVVHYGTGTILYIPEFKS